VTVGGMLIGGVGQGHCDNPLLPQCQRRIRSDVRSLTCNFGGCYPAQALLQRPTISWGVLEAPKTSGADVATLVRIAVRSQVVCVDILVRARSYLSRRARFDSHELLGFPEGFAWQRLS